ncbi:MAG: MltA domain-containing protein [Oligoflexales bacterium]
MNFFKNHMEILISIIFISCVTDGNIKKEDVLVKDEDFSWDAIDLEHTQDFCHGVYQQEIYLKRRKNKNLSFGGDKISSSDYALSLHKIHDVCVSDPSHLSNFVKSYFDVYRVVGENQKESVLLTSYFEPVINGVNEAVYPYTMPIYGVPQDLIEVVITKQKLYGRFKKPPSSHIETQKIIEYFKRHEIDKKTLKNTKVFAWVDPIEGFFMQIQGSGQINILDQKKKKVRLGYASQNGHSFYPIGRSLLGVIPREKMSMDSIKSYLRGLSSQKALEIMHSDPSYVFFQELQGRPKTSNGTEVVDGHTVATDNEFFDKGILGILKFKDPDQGGKKIHRFVLNQDRGGAIRGPNRVDLFWGTGDEAGHKAGAILQKDANLMYLKPKNSALRLWKLAMVNDRDEQKGIQIQSVGV